jgi:hypothetical protein
VCPTISLVTSGRKKKKIIAFWKAICAEYSGSLGCDTVLLIVLQGLRYTMVENENSWTPL